MKKHIFAWVMLAVVAAVSACGGQNTQPVEITGGTESVLGPEHDREPREDGAMKMNVQIENSTFTAVLEDNPAVDSLIQMMGNAPVVTEMNNYSGFEKVGSLGIDLPASNSQTTTQSEGIVLYNGNRIVIFYGSSSWSYTRLDRIDDLSGWEKALGSGDVTVTFSVEQIGIPWL